MPTHEIRDSQLAREHLLAGLWLSRAISPGEESVKAALAVALEMASEGHPLPPLGFVADVERVALGAHGPHVATEPLHVPGFDSALVRKYEDYVLGKLYADLSFERGADALLRYQGRDRIRGLAYLLERMQARTGCGGTILSPAIIKSLQQVPPQELLAEGWRLLQQSGLSPALIAEYEDLVTAVRNTGDLLGTEDVFELEHGTALAEYGQRVALRQVLAAARELAAELPQQKPRAQPRREQVATRILDEDAYPVGGFSSISTKGSIESLLHSQLALLEETRPDLFDIKYVRDELLYYSRDENQFLRRRRTYLFALDADLTAARFKDPEFPWQRIVLAFGLLLAATQKLSDWLSQDALKFHFLFLTREPQHSLQDEQELLATLLSQEIEAGSVTVEPLSPQLLAARCTSEARRSLCHCLIVSTSEKPFNSTSAAVTRLRLDSAVPAWSWDDEPFQTPAESGVAGWQTLLRQLLETWL